MARFFYEEAKETMAMSRAESFFQQGVPRLLSLPMEVRQRLVEIARQKSPSAAFPEAQSDRSVRVQPELDRLAIAKTTRWLAIIREENQLNFEQCVQRLIPLAPDAKDEEE